MAKKKYPCCNDDNNLVIVETKFYESGPAKGQKSATVQQCKVCRRRHFTAHMEPLLRGMKLGGNHG